MLSGIAAAVAELRPVTRTTRRSRDGRPLASSLAAGRPVLHDGGRRSSTARAAVGPRHDVAAAQSLTGSIVVTLDEAARAMKLVAERVHVIAEGAAACAVAAALTGRAGTGKVVAVVSGGNIDLPRFASLVGACAAPDSPDVPR